MTIDLKMLISLLDAVANVIIREQKVLTELDAAIGDGDFGTSLSSGFSKVQEQLPEIERTNMGDILKKVGMTLTTSVGGVSGPIWGTAFMRAGIKAGDKTELNLSDLSEMMESALEGIIARGKANLGDKTLVDALHPAIEELEKERKSGASLAQAFEKVAKAAREGSNRTIEMVAKKGRASYLGERSKGHRDAGSWAIVLILEEVAKNLNKMEVQNEEAH